MEKNNHMKSRFPCYSYLLARSLHRPGQYRKRERKIEANSEMKQICGNVRRKWAITQRIPILCMHHSIIL